MSTHGTRLQCGTRIDELAALLDIESGASDALAPQRARRLRDHARSCPYCRASLSSLRSLADSARSVLDTAAVAQAEPGWIDSVLSGLSLEMQSGRMIPLSAPDQMNISEQTEGSLRALLRYALASPQVMVLGTRFTGDLSTYRAPVRVTITVQTAVGAPIPALSRDLRRSCREVLHQSTTLRVEAVDIVVADIFSPSGSPATSAVMA